MTDQFHTAAFFTIFEQNQQKVRKLIRHHCRLEVRCLKNSWQSLNSFVGLGISAQDLKILFWCLKGSCKEFELCQQ